MTGLTNKPLALYYKTMFNFSMILTVLQITISVLLITAILLQRRGSGLGAALGGGGESYHTKRGFEKILFVSTIVLASLFLISTFTALLV